MTRVGCQSTARTQTCLVLSLAGTVATEWTPSSHLNFRFLLRSPRSVPSGEHLQASAASSSARCALELVATEVRSASEPYAASIAESAACLIEGVSFGA